MVCNARRCVLHRHSQHHAVPGCEETMLISFSQQRFQDAAPGGRILRMR